MDRVAVCGALVISLASAVWAETAAGPTALKKKLVQYGWGIPTPAFIRAHVRAMEKRPFDGVIFQLRGGRNVLEPTPWPESKFAKDYEHCKLIQWKTFTDNFVIMLAASKQDWFNDAHWRAIEHNVRLVAKGARLARCVGVCFDQEPYGTNPWSYKQAAQRDTKSFAEYEAIVRRRGAQYVRAVESELPGAKILTFFQLGYFTDLTVAMSPKERAEKLSGKHYALLPAFLDGMLDAASPAVRIIDGNEPAYYYTESEPYFRNYQAVTQRGLLLVDPTHWAKYRAQVQVGNALYIDQVFGLRTRKVLGHYLTPQERAKWFEHNVYWSLYTADEYVWCYGERMHWFDKVHIPPGCEEAIRSARKKLATGAPLGIDLAPIVEAGLARQKAEIQSRIKKRTGAINRLPSGTAKPTIDGRLDDAAWKATKPLEPLVALATHPPKLTAQTQACVTYDTSALYVAVRCEEPAPKRMALVGQRHDDDIWMGESVEVTVSAPGKTVPFYHFMVNPRGVAWDAVHATGPDADLTYNPQWQRGVARDATSWSVEMAIPWAAMNMPAPTPGTSLRANICRQRRHAHELVAWSPMVKGFLEHELFGTWTFR